ncbi:phosphotransferase enzyme family-domain-containing protein [Xylaria palmicola]|nr:phosphotransferase enzyme family-domain-containing protein [Xylaria palmicola]
MSTDTSYDSLFGSDSEQASPLEASATLSQKSPCQAGGHSAAPSASNPDESNTFSNDTSHSPPAWLDEDPACGLAWAKDGLHLHPTCTIEPTIESIVTILKSALGSNREYDVRFLHQGALSRLFDVFFDNQAFVMRICLPVCPRMKTESEIATLDWVCRHTPLPVPRVVAYDVSRGNPIGFEWVLMTKLEGKPLLECWASVTMGSKERLVRQIAAFSAAAFAQPFREGIGSVFKATDNSNSRAYGRRATFDHNRGPFSDICDWMLSRLRLASSDLTSRLGDAIDEMERDTFRQMLDMNKRIERLVSKISPSSAPRPPGEFQGEAIHAEPGTGLVDTVLCHDNLSLDNILVNDDGILTGVLDWQCISCLPLHEASQFPAFLQQAYDRSEEPVGRRYLIDEGGPPHPAYARNRKRYELTRLRQLYIEEMMQRAPGVVDVWRDEASADLRDLEAAVQNCDNEFTIGVVGEWVAAVENERGFTHTTKRLHELLME